MNFASLKLELIQRILETENPELLEQIADLFSREPFRLREPGAYYELSTDEPVRLEDLSPELQESIKRGLEELDRGEGISNEEDEQYWEKWFEEN